MLAGLLNNFKMTQKKTFTFKQSNKNKRFTAYLLLIIISINSSTSLPIAQNNNSKYINLQTDLLTQESLLVTATRETFGLNSDLDKFVKGLINQFDENADLKLEMKELKRMFSNTEFSKLFDNALFKSTQKLLTTTANVATLIKSEPIKLHTAEPTIRPNDNLKWNKKKKMQENFRKTAKKT